MKSDKHARGSQMYRASRSLTGLLALAAFAMPLLASIAVQAQQAPPNLTPEQKAKIEEMRKKRKQQHNPNAANEQQPRSNPKAGRKGQPSGTAEKPATQKPAVQVPPPKKWTPPSAAAKTIAPPPKPPAAANQNLQNNKRRPYVVRKPGTPPNPNAHAPAGNPPRQAVNPAYPAASGGVNAPRATNPAYPTVPQAVKPASPKTPQPAADSARRRPPGAPPPNLEAIKQQRQQIVGKRSNAVVIKEPDSRVIVKRNNRAVITHNESNRLRRVAPNAQVERRNGQNVTVIQRPNNVAIYNVTDDNGQLVRRYRRGPDGREVDIIDNRRNKSKWRRNLAIGLGVGAGVVAGAAILNSMVDVPPPHVGVPRDKYIVDYDDADEDEVYEAFNAPPVDRIERRYTLDEVRATPNLRERMRRVDLSDINFETGSWEVDESQYQKLERAARAMMRVIDRNPNEVFLIEGYTDAVGSDDDNLTLSDRRAESVAVILSEEFNVPPENLTTQGYGEQYLKINTNGPERTNRRVAIRRITPLISETR